MKQVGIPLFYLQGMGGGAVLKFRDLFNDASLFWGWRLFLGELPTGKSGTEISGRYTLAGTAVNCQWDAGDNQALRLFTGVLTYPCEIITRLDTFGGNVDTMAGLFISPNPVSFGSSNYWAIQRRKDAGFDGIAVVENNGPLASVAITTLPMWFRIRLGSGSLYALNAYFDYSLDGLNWINLYVQNTGWLKPVHEGMAAGLYVSNLISANACSGGFDHFLMKPKSIN